MQDEQAGAGMPAYRVIQKGRIVNIGVDDLESLVTHHPDANVNARVVRGVVIDGEARKTHAVIGVEIEEVRSVERVTDTGAHEQRVLMKKDFMLEDSRIASGGAGVRDVDVPAPFAGYIGQAGGTYGTVDIYDRQGGTLLARVLHLEPLNVRVGDQVEYGQSLGTQDRTGLRETAGKHVHMEVDTAHHNAFENYMSDLLDGRLSMDPARRTRGMDARVANDDGVVRVGESSDRVRDVQRHLNAEGFRDARGRELAIDGNYSLAMQPAVIRFQAAREVPQSGDLDAATLQHIPQPQRREVDRPDHRDRGFAPMGVGPFGTTTDPQVPARHPLHE